MLSQHCESVLEARDGLDELIEVDNSDLDLLIDAWQGCSLADLNLARDQELLTELHDGRSDAAGAGELGKYLKPFVNDVFNGHYLRREFDSDSKTWRYFLDPVPDAPKLLSEGFNFSSLETLPKYSRSTPVTGLGTKGTGGSSGQVLRDSDDEDLSQLVGTTEARAKGGDARAQTHLQEHCAPRRRNVNAA